MEFKLKTNDVKNRFREYDISGDITVQNIEPLMAEMADCVKECDDLAINLVQVGSFDTSALQLFYSIKNSFIRDKKKLKVTCNLSAEAEQLLANCGVTELDKLLSIDLG